MELNFLADLASDMRMRDLPFVIIGAYRDNEVGEGHFLNVALAYMKKNNVKLYTIDILPFTQQELKELLYEIMGRKNEIVPYISTLEKLLFEKSLGNLFFYFEVHSSVCSDISFCNTSTIRN